MIARADQGLRTIGRRSVRLRMVEQKAIFTGGGRSRASITVGQYLEEWLGSLGMSELEAATISWYRSAVRRHIVPAFGKGEALPADPHHDRSIPRRQEKNGRLDGAGGLGPKRIRRLQVTVHKALDAAVRKSLLTCNPCDLADRVKLAKADVTLDVRTPEELSSFVTATSPRPSGGVVAP